MRASHGVRAVIMTTTKHRPLRRKTVTAATKPDGGFHCVSTRQICLVWCAYRLKILPTFLDVRVYWALHEFAERREAASRRRKGKPSAGFAPNETALAKEVRGIVGGASLARVRASIRNLKRAGLVQITSPAIRFPAAGDDIGQQIREAAEKMLERIHTRREIRERIIPIARRSLCFLAATGKAALMATVQGHAIRCLWAGGRRQIGVGSCSTAFVAELFGVHERNVKRARKELQRIGWLRPLEAPRWHVNRYGARVGINQRWVEPGRPIEYPPDSVPMTKSPPPSVQIGTKSPPPNNKQNLHSGSKNQNPATGGPSGVRRRTVREIPNLSDIVPTDLQEPGRLNVLFEQALKAGVVADTISDRLRFFGAAAHARRVGQKNPCGLFVAIVRRGLWRFVSQADEDLARSMLQLLTAEARKESRSKTAKIPNIVLKVPVQHAHSIARLDAILGSVLDQFRTRITTPSCTMPTERTKSSRRAA